MEVPEKLKKDLSKDNVYFVLRTGRKIMFTCTTRPKFAIMMEMNFKTEQYAKDVEDWFCKQFDFSRKSKGREQI